MFYNCFTVCGIYCVAHASILGVMGSKKTNVVMGDKIIHYWFNEIHSSILMQEKLNYIFKKWIRKLWAIVHSGYLEACNKKQNKYGSPNTA